MKGPLFWVLTCVLFLVAVASFVFSLLVKDHENHYLSWVAVVIWAVLCLALAVVLKAGFL